MKYLITIPILCSFAFSIAYAQDNMSSSTGNNTMSTQTNTVLSHYAGLLLPQEKNFNLVMTKPVLHNKQSVTLYRYEPTEKMHLNQEHVSFLIKNDTEAIQGFVRLRPQYEASQPQVSKENALQASITFLKTHAPDLLDNYKNSWIDKHDEIIIVNGKKVTLAGMKVKCRDLNTGLYFWTIVAPDERIMVFERDVEWDFIRAGRQTQKWLHDDSWLSKHME